MSDGVELAIRRVMILAAGLGTRLRPLTLTTPKVLIPVRGVPLVEHVIRRLKAAGLTHYVINVAYLGERIQAALGDGSSLGVSIVYSIEPEPLETGGGIFQALPLLKSSPKTSSEVTSLFDPFWVVSGDVLCDYSFKLPEGIENKIIRGELLGHLVMVDNPSYHPEGDFILTDEGKITRDLVGNSVNSANNYLTYGNIGFFSPKLWEGCQPGIFKLSVLLEKAMVQGKISGEYYAGPWANIGTQQDVDEQNKKGVIQ